MTVKTTRKSTGVKTVTGKVSQQIKAVKQPKPASTGKVGKSIKAAKQVLNNLKQKKTKKADLPVEIVCVVDRSGSMSHLEADVVGGINSFIAEQKKVKGAANLTIAIFDDVYEVIFDRVDLKNVRNMTDQDFKARGSTALNDAIGKTVVKFEDLKKSKSINKAIFAIMTDGGENASSEFRDKASLKALTERVQKDYDWKFVYLAANQDAFVEGAKYGILNTMNFAATGAGTRSATQTYSSNVTSFRTEK